MYEVFVKLMQENHVTAYQVSKATGIAQSSLSDWKRGKSSPKYAKLLKIADYFGVTIDYLLGKTEDPRFDCQVQSNQTGVTVGYTAATPEHSRATEQEKKPTALSGGELKAYLRTLSDDEVDAMILDAMSELRRRREAK